MADSETTSPETSATSANTGNIVALHADTAPQRPSDKVIGFVKRHPVITVAGGIAIGATVAALLPRRMTRGAASKAVALAETAGASTVMFGKRAGTQMRRLGRHAGHDAHSTVEELESKAEIASEFAVGKLEKLAGAAVAMASSLGRLSRREAAHVGEAVSEGSHKVSELAHDLSEKVRP